MSPDNRREIGSRYSKYVLAVLVVVYIFNQVDRTILSILAEDIKADLGISDAKMGFLYGTAFAVFYALFGIQLGRLADTWMRKSLISIGLVFWSLMTALSGTARCFASLAGYRIGVGIGEASASPAAFSMLSDYFSARVRTTVLGIYSSGVYLGTGLGIFVGGMILDGWKELYPVHAPLGLKGWQVAFFAAGIPGILMSLCVWALREPTRGQSEGIITPTHPHPFKEAWGEFKAMLPPFNFFALIARGGGSKAILLNVIAGAIIAAFAMLIDTVTHTPAQWAALGIGVYCVFSWGQSFMLRDPATFAMIFRCRSLVFAMLGFPALSFMAYGLIFWAPPYFQRAHGVAPGELGIVLGACAAIGGATGVILGGVIADWLRGHTVRGKIHVGIASAAFSIPLAVGMLLTENLIAAYVLYFLFMLAAAMFVGPATATVNDLVLPRMRAVASAFYLLMVTFIGLALGPYTIGQVSDVITSTGVSSATALREGMLWSIVSGGVSIALLIMAARTVGRDEETRLERARALGEDLCAIPAGLSGKQ